MSLLLSTLMATTQSDSPSAIAERAPGSAAAELDGGGAKDQGFKSASAALQAHPDLAAIFAINDPSALGAYTALEQAKKVGQVKIIGFDGELAGKQAIKDGKFFADPIQFPVKMGQTSVQNIIKYLNGEEFEEMVLIPTYLYRKADADKDPELKGARARQDAPP